MKHIKKVVMLLLSAVMVIGMSTVAFAANTTSPGADDTISVTGIDKGDKVTVYQFVSWVDGTGWVVNENAGVTLDDITDGLTLAELGTIASHTSSYGTPVARGVAVGDDGKWELANPAAGSYLVLIQDTNNDTIYNPIVVSADFDSTTASTVALTDNMALAKKEPVDVQKVAGGTPDNYDVQVGDEVPFTVTSNVPTYNSNWTNPMYQISDKLSTGLTLKAEPTVSVAGYTVAKGTDYTLTKGAAGDDGFTVKFTDSFLKRVAGNPAVTIQYTAVVGEAVKDTAQVHEETNKVKLEFSNNPEDSSSHGVKEDETHHYTFAIDATRLGQGSEKTNELIKVGVDENGEAITTYKEGTAMPTGVSPLAGAEFTLTGTGANNEGTVTLTATSDSDGRIFFNNLEAGTYTLAETKAPAGYIRDTETHQVVISAVYGDNGVLQSYTITIDGEATSTYTATTDAEEVTYVVPEGGNDSFPINNIKGSELPSTGGIGTIIFYTLGSLLVIGCGIVLISKRRLSKEK